jgi:hypothetical protein
MRRPGAVRSEPQGGGSTWLESAPSTSRGVTRSISIGVTAGSPTGLGSASSPTLVPNSSAACRRGRGARLGREEDRGLVASSGVPVG